MSLIVLWEEGNVEFNKIVPRLGSQAVCNVRGTCLCADAQGGEVQLVGRAA